MDCQLNGPLREKCVSAMDPGPRLAMTNGVTEFTELSSEIGMWIQDLCWL